jgi:predicted tellurium resistance membrane protein TerC
VDGQRVVTPLFVVLVAIGSVRARAAGAVLVLGLVDRLAYLCTELALVLGVVGVKLALHWGTCCRR